MAFESDKVMFEIYRETQYSGKYRVVYFTELQDHNKETEINHALNGEHYYDGFIKNYRKEEAKQIIEELPGAPERRRKAGSGRDRTRPGRPYRLRIRCKSLVTPAFRSRNFSDA